MVEVHTCSPGCRHHLGGAGFGDAPLVRLGYNRKARAEKFPYLKALLQRPLVFDGAMGTELQKRELTPEDYGGEAYFGCPEVLNRTRPDVIQEIHRAYLEAGAEVIETNTFGALRHVLAEYGLEEEAEELAYLGARIAKEVAEPYGAFVAGALGPGTKLISLGQISWDELFTAYQEAVRGLLRGGVDLILLETAQDILQVRCAVLAAREAMAEVGREVPLQVQVTMEATGTMLVGTDEQAALAALESLPIDVVGMNCATGPDLMDSKIRYFAENATRFVSCLPNAGLPRNEGGKVVYDLTPEELARWHLKFVTEYGVNAVGGCCGTGPEHIRKVAEVVKGKPAPKRKETFPPQVASLYQAVPLRQEASVFLVGERLNATGSKRFREMLFARDLEGILALAREQVEEGAHALDLSVAWTGRDELQDLAWLLPHLATAVTVPFMVDSTSPLAMEFALKHLPGRVLLNSANLEDGLEKFDRVASLAKAHGAALVALVIDEKGMAKTQKEKVQVALRMYERLTEHHGFRPEDLLFDLLTFPITQGDEESRPLAKETLLAMEELRERLPGVGFILGVSNVSFGLKPRARRVLNSVFLDEARKRGLTAAIVDAGKILPISQIPEEAYALALDLIYDRRREGFDPLLAFMGYFETHREELALKEDAFQALPVLERLKRRVVEGRKGGLELDLDEALREGHKPLDLINGPLLSGMKEVGELFGAGKMQLPFVLQAAEVMKRAVAHLEPHMERRGEGRGKMVLATVKGDVHDIGKNLVDIILTNNGYQVVNLGIKVPIEEILKAVEEHKPHAVGMSGLLVKSTVVMKENLEYMRDRGYDLPVILGGAALTRSYVEELRDIYPRVYYAEDAFEGLRLMEELTGHAPPELTRRAPRPKAPPKPQVEARARPVGEAPSIPRPPFFGVRVEEGLDLATIAHYVNKLALYRGQWGYSRKGLSREAWQALVEREAEPVFQRLLKEAREEGWLTPKVLYGFFPVAREGEALLVFSPETGEVLESFRFPRQQGGGLSLVDYFRPRFAEPLADEEAWMPEAAFRAGARDVLGVQLVTMGEAPSRKARALFEAGAYQDYLFVHGFSVEMTEALAEYWHKRMRQMWGIAGKDATEIRKLFQQGYQGARYSFGYPACPDLADQAKLDRLMDFGRVGVRLTENFQLDPEHATSAIVVHHPEARYFNVD
ncbi:methionine synthase [Thermus scotoductus]|uniref:Methionine synthase n=1 Tax=Thermus scotoductus TaxID=37636 RepID=A0A430RE57_THESC|nr:methionine synthase [Thermus scotoductus]RTG94047.1 methionine synthase [Thermus scotoductus]RTH05657.1 methionine synthase [Thermus scotoductus]RTH16292.1 methionine synthase [Thermus scotoductus]RTH96150.1 methionine synthase [Thermus scotoductus]RTI25305.1 methionine synthase [Thermus scotoductus]